MREKLADSFSSQLDLFLPLFDPKSRTRVRTELLRKMLAHIRDNVPGYGGLKEPTVVRWFKNCKEEVTIWKADFEKQTLDCRGIASGAHNKSNDLFKIKWVELIENARLKLGTAPDSTSPPPTKKFCYNAAPVKTGKVEAFIQGAIEARETAVKAPKESGAELSTPGCDWRISIKPRDEGTEAPMMKEHVQIERKAAEPSTRLRTDIAPVSPPAQWLQTFNDVKDLINMRSAADDPLEKEMLTNLIRSAKTILDQLAPDAQAGGGWQAAQRLAQRTRISAGPRPDPPPIAAMIRWPRPFSRRRRGSG